VTKRNRRPTGRTPAVSAAAAAGIAHEVLEYAHDPDAGAYGEEAARALGLDPDTVFKTLVAAVEGRDLAVAIVPVAARLDLKKLAAALGAKRATMADPVRAERATGYVVGGISPLGQRKALPTVIDESARALARVHVSAGRRGLEIALAPADLAALCAASFADIAR